MLFPYKYFQFFHVLIKSWVSELCVPFLQVFFCTRLKYFFASQCFFALECAALSSCCSLCPFFHFWMSGRCKLAVKILPLAAPSLLKKGTNHCCDLKTPRHWKPLSPSEVFKGLLSLWLWSQVYSRISEDPVLGRAFWKQAKRELRGGGCEKSWWQGWGFVTRLKSGQTQRGLWCHLFSLSPFGHILLGSVTAPHSSGLGDSPGLWISSFDGKFCTSQSCSFPL